MEREVVYIAELDADVDDVVAAEYLFNMGVLKEVVLDPIPRTSEGKNRKKCLEDMGIKVSFKIPPVAKYIFCGGALTLVSRYILTHHIDALVMNGGFVGSNIIAEKDQLEKFKGKETVRTFNFNCDVDATDRVLRSSVKQIGMIILVGKNVCHSVKNTERGIWNDEESKKLFRKYRVRPDKRQHDMLACHEGLSLLSLVDGMKTFCRFIDVNPFNTGKNGKMTEWGSTANAEIPKTSYRNVLAAIEYKEC